MKKKFGVAQGKAVIGQHPWVHVHLKRQTRTLSRYNDSQKQQPLVMAYELAFTKGSWLHPHQKSTDS
jgi:hypothetical protein